MINIINRNAVRCTNQEDNLQISKCKQVSYLAIKTYDQTTIEDSINNICIDYIIKWNYCFHIRIDKNRLAIH